MAYLSFWSLSQPCKQVCILSRVCTCGFQSCHHLAASLSVSLSLCLSLSGSGVHCQITPEGHAWEVPSLKNFPAHASGCYSQSLCTALRARERKQSRTHVLRCTGLQHCNVRAQRGMPPSVEPCLPELVRPKPQVGPASAGSTSTPIHGRQSKSKQEAKRPRDKRPRKQTSARLLFKIPLPKY